MEKCIACGACTEKCPKKVDSEYDAATGKRKAIYVKYAQAVPLKYQIDAESLYSFQESRVPAVFVKRSVTLGRLILMTQRKFTR